MATSPPRRTPGSRLSDVEVGVEVLKTRTDGLERKVETLASGHAATAAALEHVRDRLLELAQEVKTLPATIGDEIDGSEKRIFAHLERQDETLESARASSARAATAAETALAVAEDARVTARREWPTIAKAAVGALASVAAGLLVYALTHVHW